MKFARHRLSRLATATRTRITPRRDVLGQEAEYIWHKDTDLKGADVVILPGGFAHGDYLRTGAMARFSPIMREVQAFAERGGPVLGICNGFQMLLEAGLLPGAMLRNEALKFRCEHVHVRVEQTDTPFTCGVPAGPGAADPDRATAKATTSREPDVIAAARSEPAGGLPLHRPRRATSTTTRTRTDRSARSPASATRRATSSA